MGKTPWITVQTVQYCKNQKSDTNTLGKVKLKESEITLQIQDKLKSQFEYQIDPAPGENNLA